MDERTLGRMPGQGATTTTTTAMQHCPLFLCASSHPSLPFLILIVIVTMEARRLAVPVQGPEARGPGAHVHGGEEAAALARLPRGGALSLSPLSLSLCLSAPRTHLFISTPLLLLTCSLPHSLTHSLRSPSHPHQPTPTHARSGSTWPACRRSTRTRARCSSPATPTSASPPS